jgi:hypothetical protein
MDLGIAGGCEGVARAAVNDTAVKMDALSRDTELLGSRRGMDG